jgi:hypothetical protein
MTLRPIFLVAVLVTHLPHAAFAVCLNGNPSIEQEYRDSSAVFTGHVVSAKDVPDFAEPGFLAGTRYVVRVTRVFKGRPGRTITLFTEYSSGRFPMDVGADYLVFLSVRKGEPAAVDYCGNSGLLREKSAALDVVARLSIRR